MNHDTNTISELTDLHERMKKLSWEIQIFVDGINQKSNEQFLEEFPTLINKLNEQYHNIIRMKFLAATLTN
ncbi:MAG: hypothetical protein WBA07_20275 [Rivularia sp. (in: cyanobacteria)]